MATEIENRVVQMTFNNKSFEKNVEKTLSTLDKLKQKLKFDDASKGFEEIQNAAEDIDLRKVADNVQTLSDRFSALGIIGMQMWTRIGDAAFNMLTGPFRAVKDEIGQLVGSVTNQIKTGGWNRALNLDKAENMIKNLGYGWDSSGSEMASVWNKEKGILEDEVNIYKYVDKAVSGTAYSLDEAAVATGNLLPALSKLNNTGDQVTDTLRAIMGVSSTYSKDFNQIAGYFQKVATAGSVTQGIISDMTMVGVESASVLQDYLGLTQEEYEDALENHLITFEQFRDAFLDKFGDSLDKANDTYEGALSNAKSALSRIGAKVDIPLLDELIDLLNLERLATNAFNAALGDETHGVLSSVIGEIRYLSDSLLSTFAVMEKGEDGVTRVVGLSEKALKIVELFRGVMTGVGMGLKGVANILHAFGEAFYEVFLSSLFNKSEGSLDGFRKKMMDFWQWTRVHKDDIKDAFVGFLTVIKSIGQVIIAILKPVLKIAGILLGLVGAIIVFVGNTIKAIKESEAFKKIVDKVQKAIKSVKDAFKNATDAIKKFVDENKILEKVSEWVHVAWDAVSDAISKVWGHLKDAFDGIVDAFKKFYDNAPSLTEVLDSIKEGFEKIWDAIDKAVDRFSEWSGIKIDFPSLTEIQSGFDNLKTDIINAFNDPQGTIDTFLTKLEELAGYIKGGFSDAIADVQKKFGDFKDWIGNLAGGSKKTQEDLAGAIDNVDGASLKDKADSLNILAKAFDNFATGLDMLWEIAGKVGKKIIDGLAAGFKSIKEIAGDMSFTDFLGIIKEAVNIFLGIQLGRLAGELAGFMDTINGIYKGSSKTIKLLTEQLPNALLKIAVSMVAVAIALGQIGNMKDDDLKKAETAITGLFALASLFLILLRMLELVKRNSEDTGLLLEKEKTKQSKFQSLASKAEAFFKQKIGTAIEFAALGAMISLIGTAVLKIAGAIYVLAKAAESKNFGSAMLAFAAVIGSIIILVYEIAKLFTSQSKAGADNLKVFQKMNPKAIAAMGWFLKEFGKAVLLIAVAISALAVVSEKFDLMEGLGTFVVIALILFGLIAAVSAVVKKMDSSGAGKFDWAKELAGFVGMAFFIMALAAALILMIPSIIAFSMMDLEQLAKGVGTVAILMIVMGAVVAMIGQNKPGLDGIVALIAIVALVIAFSSAISTIDGVENPGTVITVLALMIGLVGVMAFIASKCGKALEAAALIASIGASVLLIAKSMEMISNTIDEGNALQSIACIVLLLVLIGVMALAMSKINIAGSTGILALSALLLSVGASVFLFAAGLAILIPLIEEIGAKSHQFVAGLELFGKLICAVIVGFIGTLIATIKARAAHLSVEVAATVLSVIIAIIDFLNDNAFQIGEAFGHLMAALAKAFVAAVVSFVMDIKDTITGKQGFDEHSPSKWFLEVGKNLIFGLINGIKAVFEELWEIIGKIISGIFGFFKDPLGMLKDVGSKIVQGLANGISGAIGFVTSAVDSVMSSLDGLQDTVSSKLFGDPEAEGEKIRQEKAKLEAELKAAGRSKTEDYLYTNGGMDALQELQKELELIDLQRKNIMKLRNIDHKDTTDQERDLKWQMGLAESNYRKFLQEIYRIHDQEGVAWEDLVLNYNGIDYYGMALLRAVGEDVAKGFDNGVMAAAKTDKTAYKWADMTASQLKEYWQIASPSKLTRKFGRFVAQGFGLGIDDDSDIPLLAFADMLTNIEDYAEGSTISPVMDFTDLQNGINSIDTLNGRFKTEIPAEVDLMNKTNTTRLDNLTDVVNSLIANDKTQAITDSINAQNDLIVMLSDKIDSIGIYLDSSAIVGGITSKMDKALGFKAGMVGRSVHA